ncbi:hypothetical protein [Bosea massiliensis]|uniref:Uncharacterized protein n=1 Tax=Bosea massiliensis TaxID=151419 RepID=A0ABW0NXT9_9HYPH
MMQAFPNELLDDLLSLHEVRADIDVTIETVRALGLPLRQDTIRHQAALHQIEPDRAELIVALVMRRLSSEGSGP